MQSAKPKLFAPPRLHNVSLSSLTKRTIAKVIKYDIGTHAAAISFYSMLASVPLMVVVITLFTQVMPPGTAALTDGEKEKSIAILQFKRNVRRILPAQAYDLFDEQVARVSTGNSLTLMSVGLILSTWIASGVFATICKAMTLIYEGDGRTFVRLRAHAFLLAVLQAMIFSVVLLVFFVWPLIAPLFITSKELLVVSAFMEWLVMILAVLMSFALLLHLGAPGPRRHPIITPGTLFATPIFLLATGMFRVYVQFFGRYEVVYGSLGGVMVLLLWFWIAAQVLLIGAVIDSIVADSAESGQLSSTQLIE